MKLLICATTFVFLPYTFIVIDGRPMRWLYQAGSPVIYEVNPANEPFAGASNNVRNAMEEWNNVTSSAFEWGYGGTTASSGTASDNTNAVSFGGNLGNGVLAITQPHYIGASHSFGGTQYSQFDEMDIVFGAGINFGPNATLGSGQFSIEAVALHEAGHGLGLDHPDQAGQSVTAVMNSSIANGDTSKSTPSLDDAQGITQLYDSGVPLVYPGYTVDTDFGYAPLTVSVTDASINATSWNWTFGDGNTSTQQNPTHIYQTVGTYTLGQTVNATVQGSDTQIQAVAMPFVDFTADVTQGQRPLTVRFTNNSAGTIYGYAWDFGDSVLSNDTDPVHEYLYTGTYNVTLTVTGIAGDVLEVKQGFIVVDPKNGGGDAKNPFEQFLEDMGCSCTVSPASRQPPAGALALLLALFGGALFVRRRASN